MTDEDFWARAFFECSREVSESDVELAARRASYADRMLAELTAFRERERARIESAMGDCRRWPP